MAREKRFSREGVGNPPRDSQPHGGLPPAESFARAKELSKIQSEPDDVVAPTSSSNPADPRTSAVSYYSLTQTVVIQWGDGGPAYAYYDVTPQEWEGLKEEAQDGSPGRYIESVLNYHSYGRMRYS
jgi:hypothetical protein